MPLTNLAVAGANIPPSYQQFLATGANTYYPTFAFLCSTFGVTPTAGATYTNNAATFTVTQVVGLYLYATSSGFPGTSGTLTKTSGVGDTTVTFSGWNQPKKIRVIAVGGGGGSSGSGTSGTGGGGGTGGTTTFGVSLITCTGGIGGATSGSAGAGGSATIASPATGEITLGTAGGFACYTGATGTYMVGGQGGSTPLGGGPGAGNQTNGAPGTANTGGGASGAGTNAVNAIWGGGGGGGAGYANAVINNPAASYALSVGIGGTAGGAGTSGAVGYVGGTGAIYIEEAYLY